MKRTLKFFIILIFMITFEGCEKGSFDNGTPITVSSCDDGYTAIVTGDTLIKSNDENTIVNIQDIEGEKSVCVSSGSATLIRP